MPEHSQVSNKLLFCDLPICYIHQYESTYSSWQCPFRVSLCVRPLSAAVIQTCNPASNKVHHSGFLPHHTTLPSNWISQTHVDHVGLSHLRSALPVSLSHSHCRSRLSQSLPVQPVLIIPNITYCYIPSVFFFFLLCPPDSGHAMPDYMCSSSLFM